MSSQAVIFSIMIKYNKCNKGDLKAEAITFECKNEKEKKKKKKTTLLPDPTTINVVVRFILEGIKCTVCTSKCKHFVYDMEEPITHRNK